MTDANPTVVEVEESLTGRYTQTARSGRHTLNADEPAAAGGDDVGPGPYEYLLIALGACTSMTLRMYAQLKQLPLKRVHVRLTHRKIHAEDCVDCETREGKVDEITREITLQGDLSDEQRQRLLEIANRCPVHRTLTSEIKVRSRLVRAADT
jgi:putative redox protein